MSDHIGELAALYALGILEPQERIEVLAHVEGCDPCARLLARAQDDVAAIAAAQEQHVPPDTLAQRIANIGDEREAAGVEPSGWRSRASQWIYPIAAAIVLALLPSLYFLNQNLTMHQAMVAEEDAMARIGSSPHRSAAFTGLQTANANVMYGTDGSWYCVIVRGISHPLRVVWPHDGQQTDVGTTIPHGDVALLYLPQSHRMEQLALMDGDAMVASAKLTY